MGKVTLAVGALVDDLEKQLDSFGYELPNPEVYQKDLDAVTRLYIRGFIPQSVAEKSRNKIIKEVFKVMKMKEVNNE